MRLNENKLRSLIRKEMLSYEQQQLNEGVLDFLTGIFGSGAGAMIDRAKATAAEWLLNRLGIETNGLLGRTLINVFENLEMSEMWSIISGDQARCPLIAREILEAFGETLLEQVPETFGVSTDGFWAGVFREMITNGIIRDNRLVARISQAICSLDISQLFQSAGAGADASRRLEQATQLNESVTRRGGRRAPTSQARQLREARERYRQIILAERRAYRRR